LAQIQMLRSARRVCALGHGETTSRVHLSALPQTTDMQAALRHFAFVPAPD
jgi:hypothetical protein